MKAAGLSRMWRWALGAVLWLGVAHGAELASAFDQANQLYERGKFADAIAAYDKLLAAGGVSAAIYFNAGNACFRAGQLGRAIYHYRRAERLAPRDPDIRANLRFARNNVVPGTSPPLPAWRRWAYRLTLDEWTQVAALFGWGWLGLVAVGQARPRLRAALRRQAVWLALLGVVAGAGVFLTWAERYQAPTAIVVERQAVLRHGPLPESPSLQPLQDGQELKVLDQKDNWLRVEGASRGIGWLRRDQVALLGP